MLVRDDPTTTAEEVDKVALVTWLAGTDAMAVFAAEIADNNDALDVLLSTKEISEREFVDNVEVEPDTETVITTAADAV